MPAGKRREAAPIAHEDDDEIPQDIDAFRNALARKISIFVSNEKGGWRSCAAPCCKRARGCCAPRGLCSRPTKPRPIKPEHAARNRAALQRDLAAACAQDDAEADAQDAGKSHKKS